MTPAGSILSLSHLGGAAALLRAEADAVPDLIEEFGLTGDVRDAVESEWQRNRPYFRAMGQAGAWVLEQTLTASDTPLRALPKSKDRDGLNLARRCQWACMLMHQRVQAGEADDAGASMDWALWQVILRCSPVEVAGIDGIWRIVTGQAGLTADSAARPQWFAKWMAAPLLPPVRMKSEKDWAKLYRSAGLDRGAAKAFAVRTVQSTQAAVSVVGQAVMDELARADALDPMSLMYFAKLIHGGTSQAMDLVYRGDSAVMG